MNLFDMKTVIISYVISSAICAAVVASLWLQNRKRFAGLGFWLADFVIQFIALALVALRGAIPELISTTVGNSLIIGGTILLLIGLERFVGKRGPQLYNIILFAVFTFIHFYFVIIHPDLLSRTILFSLGLLAICSQCAWLMLRRVDADMRPFTRSAGALFVAYCVVSIARLFVDLIIPSSNDFFRSNGYDTSVVLLYQMFFIILTFNLFLMVNRRLVVDLEHDIVARKQAETALELSQEKFHKAFHASPDSVIISRASDGQLVEINEGFSLMTGYSREEALGSSTVALELWVHPQERTEFIHMLHERVRVHEAQYEFRAKSGKIFPGLLSAEIITIGDEEHILSVLRDITERRQAEAALLESGALYRQMFTEHSAVKLLIDPSDGNIVDANPAASRYYGYPIESLQKMNIAGINVMPARELEAIIQDVLGQNQGHYNFRHRLASGEVRDVEGYSAPIHVKGRQLLYSIIHDVTERKILEESVRNRNDILETLHQVTLDLVNRRDLDDLLQTFLVKISKLLDAPDVSVDLIENGDTIITCAVSSDQPLKVGDTMRRGEGGFLSWQAIDTGQPAVLDDYETWSQRRDLYEGFPIHAILIIPIKHNERATGTINFSRREANRPFNETDIYIAGQLAQTVALVMDNARVYALLQNELHEREQAEAALRQSDERYQAFISQSFTAIYRTEFDHPIDTSLPAETQIDLIYEYAYMAECNQALADMYNLPSVETMIGMRLLDAHSGSHNPANRAAFQKFIEGGYKSIDDETLERDLQGNPVWFLSNTIGIVENGFLIRMWGTSVNITERKRAEQALRSSEERFRQLVTSAPDAVFGVTEDNRIIFANVEATRLLGYTFEEFVGMDVDLLVPSRSRDLHVSRHIEYLAHPRIRPMGTGLEISILRKDGNEVPVDIKLSHLSTNTGTLVIVFIRDISERKQAEQKLQQAQEQVLQQQRVLAKIEERQRMARDLHDSVNQSIHSLILFSETLVSTLEKNNIERARQISDRLQESARQALKETRLMLYQLQPSGPGRSIDLVRDLETRLSTVERRSGVKASIILEGSLDECPEAWAENLFWIAIEALNNTLKHAQARHVKITIRSFPEMIEMEIDDDGIGFDSTRVRSGGMGLRTMQERAAILDGVLSITSKAGQGSRVSLHAEKKEQSWNK